MPFYIRREDVVLINPDVLVDGAYVGWRPGSPYYYYYSSNCRGVLVLANKGLGVVEMNTRYVLLSA